MSSVLPLFAGPQHVYINYCRGLSPQLLEVSGWLQTSILILSIDQHLAVFSYFCSLYTPEPVPDTFLSQYYKKRHAAHKLQLILS